MTAKNLLRAVFAAFLLSTASSSVADEWRWSVAPYAWATDVGVDVTLDDRQLIDQEIAFTDLLEDLDTVFQVHVEAQRGAHGVMLDVFDVRLSEDSSRVALPAPTGGEAILDSEIGMTILELGGIYDPHGDGRGFALLYGARVLSQRAELDIRLATQPAARSYEVEDTLVDGLVGVRFVESFGERWSAVVRADVSTGATELTWSGGAALAYAFGPDRRYALTGGYRHMVVDFDTADSLDVDMTLSGFLAGLRFTF